MTVSSSSIENYGIPGYRGLAGSLIPTEAAGVAGFKDVLGLVGTFRVSSVGGLGLGVQASFCDPDRLSQP